MLHFSCRISKVSNCCAEVTFEVTLPRVLTPRTSARTVSSKLIGFILVFLFICFCAVRQTKLTISSAFERK